MSLGGQVKCIKMVILSHILNPLNMFPSHVEYESKIAGFSRTIANFILADCVTQVQGSGINYRSLKEKEHCHF